MALAGLVAALAIPFLIIDSPDPAEGVETNGDDQAAAVSEPTTTTTTTTPTELAAGGAGEIVIVTSVVEPDLDRLAERAGVWNTARSAAVADGLVTSNTVLPPSDTDLSLLPVVPRTPSVEDKADVEEPAVEKPEQDEPGADEPVKQEPVAQDPATDPDEPTEPVAPVEEPADPEPAEPVAPVEEPADPEPAEPEPVEPEPADPEPEPEPEPDPVEIEEEPEPRGPTPPAQVNGRVPPPNGGPTAAQWDAVRKCESTHNYRAISPSGLYRGAYQFSQQTWDWVAGIHQPHLVGIDPIDAEPAWQDIMAYTLYAMRGWDQWPICGKNLL